MMSSFPLVIDDKAAGLQAVPVKDGQVAQLLAELVGKTHDDGEAVELLRQVVIALTTEREDGVSRVEGDVRVSGPVGLDEATLETLALLLGQLGSGPQSVTFDKDALEELKAAVKPVRVTGGSQTRRVELLTKSGGRVDPATSDKQDKLITTVDDYTGGEVLAEQTGADGVLTFTFTAAVDNIWIHVNSGGARVDPFGTVPNATTGIPLESEMPFVLPMKATTIQVYAPSGAAVNVWGFRR